MKIIGCDFHPSFQQIAMVDTESGETTERRLLHGDGEAQQFYESLSGPVLVGIETSGNTLWFERLLEKLGHQLLIGECYGHPRRRAAPPEVRPTRCAERAAVVAGEAVSHNLGPDAGGAGFAAVAEAPAHAGADANPGQEPVATHCHEPGHAEEEAVVEQGRAGATEELGIGAVDQTTSRRPAEDPGADGQPHRRTE